jgi:Uma2 family endonuclease
MERWLIAGELRERPATLRDRLHSRTFVCAGTELENWRRRQLPLRRTDETELIDGVPILAVEILSPSDMLEDFHEKIDSFLATGVALVSIIDPDHRTVRVYRPDGEPEVVNIRQELSGEQFLPGFRVPVARLFE